MPPQHPEALARVVRRPDIEQAAAQVIASRRAQKTRAAYAADWARWVGFCATHGFDIGQPLLPMAVAYRGELEGNYEPRTVRRNLATLSMVYRALQANGMTARNPFDSTLLPRPLVSPEGVTPEAPLDSVDAVLAAVAADRSSRGVRDYAILRILADAGVRRASVASLLKEDVHGDVIVVTLKGGRKKEAKLTPAAAAALEAWMRLDVAPGCAYVFPARDGVGHLDESGVNRLLFDRCDEARVDRFSPHCLRVAFITNGLDAGQTLRDVQASAHHASADMTGRYDRSQRGMGVAAAVAEYREKKRREAKES